MNASKLINSVHHLFEADTNRHVAKCEHSDDARHLTACWNGFEGMSTEAVEDLAKQGGVLAMIREANTDTVRLFNDVAAQTRENESLRAQLVSAMEGTQDIRATAEAALAERNLAVAALQRLLPAYRAAVGLNDPNTDDALTVQAHNAMAVAGRRQAPGIDGKGGGFMDILARAAAAQGAGDAKLEGGAA